MLSKATLSKIAALLKLTEADVLAAQADTAEKDLTLPENLVVMTTDEQTTRENNLKKEQFEAGKQASDEMFIKDTKKAMNLDFEGKDRTKFLEAYAAKVLADAKIKPDEALAEKEKQISTLKATVQKLETEKTEFEKKVQNVQLESTILRAVPANLVGVEPEEVLSSMRMKGYEFTMEDGKVVAKKNGEKIADTQLNALPIADVITGYAKERKWLGDEEGGGGEDKSGRGGSSSKQKGKQVATPTKLSEAEKAWTDQGKNVGTSEFMNYVSGLQKENPNFDMEMDLPK